MPTATSSALKLSPPIWPPSDRRDTVLQRLIGGGVADGPVKQCIRSDEEMGAPVWAARRFIETAERPDKRFRTSGVCGVAVGGPLAGRVVEKGRKRVPTDGSRRQRRQRSDQSVTGSEMMSLVGDDGRQFLGGKRLDDATGNDYTLWKRHCPDVCSRDIEYEDGHALDTSTVAATKRP